MGIGPSAEVSRYLAGVDRTMISDFWANRVQTIDGHSPGSPPEAQEFWVASDQVPGVGAWPGTRRPDRGPSW